MKRFCYDLKEHLTRIANYEMKPMDPLTEEEKESYKKQQLCHICDKEFCNDKDNYEYKKMRKVRIIVIMQVNIEVLHIVIAI